MSNIEDILVSVSKNDVQIPIRVQNRINYTLKNKTILVTGVGGFIGSNLVKKFIRKHP